MWISLCTVLGTRTVIIVVTTPEDPAYSVKESLVLKTLLASSSHLLELTPVYEVGSLCL